MNVSGSFLLGPAGRPDHRASVLPIQIRAPVTISFIGAYTTFSTWVFESWRLVENGAYLAPLVNVGGSVALGVGALILGLVIGRNV